MDHPDLTVWNTELVLKGLKVDYIVNICRYMLVLITYAHCP